MYIKLLFLVVFFLLSNKSFSECWVNNYSDKKLLENKLNSNSYKNPEPTSLFHVEGLSHDDPLYKKNMLKKNDFYIMHDAALLFLKDNNNDRALSLSKKYLFEWINKYKPSFNAIDESHFYLVFDTYGIIRKKLTQYEREDADKFFLNWANGYIDRMKNPSQSGIWVNNWNSHRVKIITMIAYILDDNNLKKQSEFFFKKQIEQNIDSDGVTIDFKDRNSLGYVVYDLEPLIDSALIAKRGNLDLYNWTSPQGSSLKKAIIWLIPYLKGDKKNIEFLRTKSQYDIVRLNRSKEPLKFFDPIKAQELIRKTAILDKNPVIFNIEKKISSKKILDLTICW